MGGTVGNIIGIVAILLVVGGAVLYIIKAKKSGKKCIGCPDSGSCSASMCSSCKCGCGKTEENSK
jgi:hypothetical protein